MTAVAVYVEETASTDTLEETHTPPSDSGKDMTGRRWPTLPDPDRETRNRTSVDSGCSQTSLLGAVPKEIGARPTGTLGWTASILTESLDLSETPSPPKR